MIGFFVVALLILAAAAVLYGEIRGLRALVLRELVGMAGSLRGLHSEAALANRQRPAAAAPPVVLVRPVALTRDDDAIHQRATVVTPPPPDLDRESTDELTTVLEATSPRPKSGAVLRLPSPAARRSG